MKKIEQKKRSEMKMKKIEQKLAQVRKSTAERCLEIMCSNCDITAMRLICAEFGLEE